MLSRLTCVGPDYFPHKAVDLHSKSYFHSHQIQGRGVEPSPSFIIHKISWEPNWIELENSVGTINASRELISDSISR